MSTRKPIDASSCRFSRRSARPWVARSAVAAFALVFAYAPLACQTQSATTDGNTSAGPTGPGEAEAVAPTVDLQACQSAPPAEQVMVIDGPVPAGTVTQIGQAVDPVHGTQYQGVVCVAVDRSAPQEVGRDFSMSVSLARDGNELAKAVGVSPEAVFNIGLWRGHPASTFLRDAPIETEGLYAVLRSKVRIREQGGPRALKLQDFARRLINEGGWSKFIRRCGSMFVSRIERGGDFTIVVNFTSTNAKERDEIQKALGGATPGAAGVDEERVQRLTDLVEKYETEVTVIRQGGAGNTGALSFPSLVKLARDLPKAVERAPRVTSFEASAYQTVESFPSQVIDRYNSADATLGQLGTLYNSARAEWNTLGTYMRLLSSSGEGWGKYESEEVEAQCREVAGGFKQTRDQYTSHINTIERAARVCINDRPENACYHNELCSVPNAQLPLRPEIPASCQRTCEVSLGDLFGSEGVGSEKVIKNVECNGLIPGRKYALKVKGGRAGILKSCNDSSGREMPINLYGGFADSPETFRNGGAALSIKPKPYKLLVPSDGKLSVPLSFENENGDKGCVYSLAGKVIVAPAKR